MTSSWSLILQLTHTNVHRNHHSRHQDIILQKFHIITVLRIKPYPFLTLSHHIVKNYIFHDKKSQGRYFYTEQKGCCNKNNASYSLKIVYSLKSLYDLASYDTVLSPVIYTLHDISSTKHWLKVWSLACIVIMPVRVLLRNTQVSYWAIHSVHYTNVWHWEYIQCSKLFRAESKSSYITNYSYNFLVLKCAIPVVCLNK